MTNKSQFHAWVKANTAHLTGKKYNTNNGWGFGGSCGIEYLLPDGNTFVRIGIASTRHAGTYPVAYAGKLDGGKRLMFEEFSELDSVVKCGKLTV